jgi:hypothetical protein
MSDINQQLKELTLLLLYLNSWEEKQIGLSYRRSWKGFDFDVLNELTDEGMINNSYKSKSVTFNDDGIEAAKQLLIKYGINIE